MARLTDAEFNAEIDALDRAERYALAMQRAHREASRARASEAALARALACEIADPENSGHIRSCPTKAGGRCSPKCIATDEMLTAAGTGL